jgi:hypothetical protein
LPFGSPPLALADAVYLGAAVRAGPLGSGPSVLQFHLLGVFDFHLLPVFEAIACVIEHLLKLIYTLKANIIIQ